jgi:hypothetical protein
MSEERRRYEELLQELHSYRKVGLEACPAAISITIEMSKLWGKLTIEDQEDVSKVSEELRSGQRVAPAVALA